MLSFDYHKPTSLEEAIKLAGSLDNAKFIAGGTDVMVLLRQKKLSPKNLISLRNIRELNYIDTKAGLKIGANITHAMVADNDFIKERYTALAEASNVVGSQQVRNVATVVGNICNAAPSADTACPLLVFDAKVVIMGISGVRELSIDDFFFGPYKVAIKEGEIVKELVLPELRQHTGSAYIKHGRREALDLPILGVASMATVSFKGNESQIKEAFTKGYGLSKILECLEREGVVFDDARIAMCVMAPRPIRAKKAEEAIKGKMVSLSLLKDIGEIVESECQPRDSIRGEAWYRRHIVKILVKRTVVRSIQRAFIPDNMASINWIE